MRLSALTYAVVTVATAAVLVYPGAGGHAAEKQAAPIAPAASAAPDADKLPDDAWGRAVRHGRDLMTRTYALIGPEVGDPYLRYAGNNLACTNCHLDSGTSPFGLPLRGVAAAYPGFNQRSGRVITLQERVNQCMTRSMAGRAMQILHERYQPGADTGEALLRHESEEGAVVVRGQLEVTIDGERRLLGPGDAYYFDSRRPHRFRNVGSEECEVVSACSPPSF